MSKQLTDAQLAANRANAKKSTGPRTPEGKLRSSFNAYKHGITANRLILCGESVPAFENMLSNYRTRFQPVDAYESSLVDTLVVIHWHMDRIRFFESAFIELEITRPSAKQKMETYPAESYAGVAYQVLAENTNLLPLFNTHLNRLSREYARINRVFLDNRRELPPPVAPAVPYCQAPSEAPPVESPSEPAPIQNEPTPATPQSRIFSWPIFVKTNEITPLASLDTPPLAKAA